MAVFKLYDRILDLLSRTCMILTGVAMVFLTVSFGWLVFGRYVLNETPTWVEQSALLLVAAIAFLGAAAGVHESRHLSVEMFRNWSPKPVRLACIFVAHVLMGGFGLIMLTASYDLAVFKWDVEIPLIHLPEGLRVVPITICGALVFLFSIGHIIRLFRGVTPPSSIPG